MPSFKSLFVLGVAALTAFAMPSGASGEAALVARSDAIAPVAARAIAPHFADKYVPVKRESLVVRDTSTINGIVGTCQDTLNGIHDHLVDITVNGTVKVDVNVLVSIVLQIKAAIDLCVSQIKAIASLSISLILTVTVTVFVNLFRRPSLPASSFASVLAPPSTSTSFSMLVPRSSQCSYSSLSCLHADHITSVSLTAFLNVCASLVVGLSALLTIAITLVVGLVADLHAVALVKVCAFLSL